MCLGRNELGGGGDRVEKGGKERLRAREKRAVREKEWMRCGSPRAALFVIFTREPTKNKAVTQPSNQSTRGDFAAKQIEQIS
jgi:hypothetical protein